MLTYNLTVHKTWDVQTTNSQFEEILKRMKFSLSIQEQPRKIVDELFTHYELDNIDSLFRILPKHIEENSFPAFLRDYIDEVDSLPAWIDHARVERAQQFFWAYGRDILLAL